MRALLIAPCFPDTFWSFSHALWFVRKRSSFPPLGLLTVAGMFPADWEVRLVDTNVRRLRASDLRWADTAWIGGMTVQKKSALEILSRCRAAGVKTVVGGPMATCEPDAFDEADHLVLNEAEVTLPGMLSDLESGSLRRVYENDEKPDLALTPPPRWDLAPLRRYASMCVQFSRGCPYDCEFCNVTALLGKRPRTKPPERVIAELDGLYVQGWRGPVFFVDDNLIGNRKEVRKLLPMLAGWQRGKQPTPFYTEATINLADDEPLQRSMVDAGFDTVFVGIETPDQDSLTECHKTQNLKRDLVADVRKLHRAGLQVQAGFIVGFDSDTASIFRRQIDFIQQSGIVTAMVGLLQAPVGTRLYESLKNQGRLLTNSSGDNVDGTTNVLTKMPLDRLTAGYKSIMNSVYAPEAYYQRLKTFLSDYRTPPLRPRLTVGQLMAFGRSVWRLGVWSRGRGQFWRLLGWTAWNRPQHFALAVRLWIYGHHFREVCRLRLQET
ncbi:Ribosomal protein S12 methylthiotransferase RimO [Posidoniimonas polymericola]|uniref:Ribosomal protein S12 methylthiotransferase RimO n=1 Tax=Posidoniimonas polymericola TaxID=2528002 RepID=A0A5C5YRJ8_9BACT|nr:B12-binding domain-containing radical SAM protein [Posidoniimonas polymericola]TWT77357.1 Ribosomal protein S12 methylthiotransferase RimO [Posidoniimonas polymericola]